MRTRHAPGRLAHTTAKLLRVAGLAALASAFSLLPACSSDGETSGDGPREPGNYDVRGGSGGSNRSGSSGPRQPDGEQRPRSDTSTTSRPEMDADLKDFLRDSVFWTGHDSIRIEAAGLYIWINPNDVPDGQRYGADYVLVTDSSEQHFSPRDVERLNDGFTRAVLPQMQQHHYRLTMPYQYIERWEAAQFPGLRVVAFPAHSDDPRHESWRNHVGYHLTFTDDLNVPEHALRKLPRIAYMGPMSEYDNYDGEGNALQTPDADIVIVSLAAPAVNSGGRAPIDAILRYAQRVNAKALVVIGRDGVELAAWNDQVSDLDQRSSIPLWLSAPPS